MKNRDIIEPLEPRIAPASIFTFTDVDGDLVKVKSNKGILTGKVHLVDQGGDKNQLVELDLRDSLFQGANITITVKKVRGGIGDGMVNVGYINAKGVDLGNVVVPGDIGRIDAGDGNSAKPAIKSLIAKSLGTFGSTTQETTPGGGDPGPDLNVVENLLETLVGALGPGAGGLLGTLQEQLSSLLGGGGLPSDIQRVLESVSGLLDEVLSLDTDSVPAVLGPVTALLANLATDLDNLLDLSVLHPGSIPSAISTLLNSVKNTVNETLFELTENAGIGGTIVDALAGIIGNLDDVLGLLNGTIDPDIPENLLTTLEDAIDDVTGGSILGGLGGLLEDLLGNNALATLVNDVLDAVDGLLNGPAGSVSLNVLVGDLTELATNLDAALLANTNGTTENLLNAVRSAVTDILALPQVILTGLNGTIGNVVDALTNDLPGTLPDGVSGLVQNVLGLLDGIGGNLSDILENGGDLATTTLRDLAEVQTQLLSLLGSTAGGLTSDVVDTLEGLVNSILGILGSGGDDDGGGGGGTTVVSQLQSHILGDVGTIKIAKDVSNVFLNIVGNLRSLTVGGSLLGGVAANGGEIFTTGNILSLKIGKSVLGGLNLNSGLIQSGGMIKTAKIGGSIIGGVGNSSGQLLMTSDSSSISVRGDIIGNAGLFAASIDSTNGRIGKVAVTGSIVSGQNTDSGSIRAAGDIGVLSVKGNLIGDADNSVVISAAAVKAPTVTKNIAFKTVSIGGRVAFANILAGYDTDLDAVNAHAQIGTVSVRGDWTASNLIAGAVGNNSGEIDDFGTNSDAAIPNSIAGSVISKIASVQIRGAISGTGGDSTDNYGFVAQEIGKFRHGNTKLVLNKGFGNDAVKLAQTTGADVVLHELGKAIV